MNLSLVLSLQGDGVVCLWGFWFLQGFGGVERRDFSSQTLPKICFTPQTHDRNFQQKFASQPKPLTEIFNKISKKAKRRRLRRKMPRAEKILWAKIRNRQLANCKFRRQYSVERFVLDFYAPEIKLAIEVDGPPHYFPGAPEYDDRHQRFIESFGVQFIRFTNREVCQHLEYVLNSLSETVRELRRHHSVTPEHYIRKR